MTEPSETGGGILADEMGMGKSLSILALILRTLDFAHEWATQVNVPENGLSEVWRSVRRSGATLIVASSDRTCHESTIGPLHSQLCSYDQ
jgi:SNF2 family DNA or RNA helicase